MKSVIRKISYVVSVLFLAGCATIVGERGQSFNVSSNPDNADIVITDIKENRTVLKAKTPTVVYLDKKQGYFQGKTYNVKVRKNGCKDVEFDITNRVSGWYIGNFVFGGLIGFIIVDPLTGAMWTLKPQTKNIENVTVKKKSISIRLLSDLSSNERNNLQPVNYRKQSSKRHRISTTSRSSKRKQQGPDKRK